MGGRARAALLLALLALVLVGPTGRGLSGEASLAASLASSERPVSGVPVGLPGGTVDLPLPGGRTVLVHVPDGLLGPAPLLLVLHGYAEGLPQTRAASGLEALADRDGFVVAFPRGRDASWAAGACCGSARDAGVDDVASLDAVLTAVSSRVAVDPRRVGVTGFSNGAMMALRYACERAGTVASVAVVAGTVATPCRPDAAVAVLDLHGLQDRTVPLDGGVNPLLGAVLPPVRSSLQPFADAGGEVVVRELPVGHRWPTPAQGGVDVGQVLWDWVRDHPRTG